MKMSLVAPAAQTRNASFVGSGLTDLIVARYSDANNGLPSNSRFRVEGGNRGHCVREIVYSVFAPVLSLLCMEVIH
jgi:hypothetical protein